MDQDFESTVKNGDLLIWWIGQGGFVFKDSLGNIVLVDPYLSFSMEGATYIHRDLPLRPETIKSDYVFCTHDDTDHTDEPTLQGLASGSSKAKFYGPPSSVEKMIEFGIDPTRIVTIEKGDRIDVGRGISVEAVFSKHKPDSLGFIINFGGITVYHTGDTEVGLESYIEDMRRVEGLRPDIMIVCINDGCNNLGPEDAARLAEFVRPRIVIPMHYDLIEENTIDPQRFLDALTKQKVGVVPVVMEYGGKYTYSKKPV